MKLSLYSKLLIRLLLIAGTCLTASHAYGCFCDKPQTIEEAVNAYHIFKGRVIKMQPLRDEYPAGETVTVTFRILEMIKGPQAEEIDVEFRYGLTSCELEKITLRPGGVYLISTFEYVEPKGKFFNNFCSLRKKLDRE